MFEFVALIAETIREVLPRLLGARKEKKLTNIGAEMYMVYIRLNEVILSGEHLLQGLEAYAYRDGEIMARDMPAMDRAMERQAQSLGALAKSVEPLARYIFVVDPTSYARLASLITGKQTALGALMSSLRAHQLPVDATTDDIASAAESIDPTRLGPGESVSAPGAVRAVGASTVDNEGGWDADAQAAVRGYLEQRQPREQLEQIRAAAAALRGALMENFDAKDLLLAVGDPKFHPEYTTIFVHWETPSLDDAGAIQDPF